MKKLGILIIAALITFGVSAHAKIIETDEVVFSNKVSFLDPTGTNQPDYNGIKMGLSGTDYVTNTLIFPSDGITSTNFFVQATNSSAIGLQYGRFYISNSNLYQLSSCRLTWYDYNDYRGSNCFWRNSSIQFFNTYSLSNNAVGTNIIYVSDASGLTTNNLIALCYSNQFYRIGGITGNVLYLESSLTSYEPSNNPVSKVVEFGGFPMSDGTSSNKLWGNFTFTNSVSNIVIQGIFKYKR